MRTTLLAVFLSVCLVGAHAEAAPILAGQVVEATYLYPDASTVYAGPSTATVGAGTELLSFANFADIDFSDTNILITLKRNAGINDVAFDGFRFFDVLGTIPNFTNVLLNPATNYTGFGASRVSFDANTIFVNVANLAGLNGQRISIDLFADDLDAQTSTVPEPSTLTLLGGPLAAFAVSAARRRKRL